MSNLNRLKDTINFIKNPKIYLGIIMTLIIVILLIAILNRKRGNWLLWVGIPTTIISFSFIISNLVLPTFIITILKKSNNESVLKILTPFVNDLFSNIGKYGLVLLGTGIIMIITSIIIKKRSKA